MTDHGKYIGPISALKNKTALLQVKDDQVTAQFDEHGLVNPLDDAQLAYGWHPFPLADFEVEERVDWSEPEIDADTRESLMGEARAKLGIRGMARFLTLMYGKYKNDEAALRAFLQGKIEE